MYSPRSLNWMAFEDGLTWGSEEGVPAKEYCYHCLNMKASNEICGRSGNQNYDNFLDSQNQPMPWRSEETYEEGQIITVKSHMSTHHRGHIELRICPTGDSASLACLDNPKYMVEFVDDPMHGAPVDSANLRAGHLAERSKIDYEMRFKLPMGVTGEKVLMQWKYVTANSCNPPGYTSYPWPNDNWWVSGLSPCYLPYTEDGSRPPNKPEQFWNCAQITIVPTTPTKSPSPSLSPSTQSPTESQLPSMSPSKITANPSMAPSEPVPTVKPKTSSPTESSAPSVSSYDDWCCSWDFKSCGPKSWCNESPNNCPICGGLTYMRKGSCAADKLAMYDDCTDNEDACCEPLTCQGATQWYKQCLMPDTCAFDQPSEESSSPSTDPSVTPTIIPSIIPTSLPSSTLNSDSANTPICSDDTAWYYDGKKSKHCGWVYMSPSKHCSKRSAEGVRASEACPIACGDLRTKTCDIPKCKNDSWFHWFRNEKSKGCNDYLHQHGRGRCRSLGVTALGNDPKFFAYEYCSQCGGNKCVP